jgi:outer membrane protein
MKTKRRKKSVKEKIEIADQGGARRIRKDSKLKKGNGMERIRIGKFLRTGAFAAAIAATSGAVAQAADLPTVKEPLAAPESASALPWFLRVGAAGVMFDSGASLTLGGVGVPGASAKASNNVTAMFELGYFINDNISVQFTGGYPPTSTLTGTGTIASLGTLGKATYGPAVASMNYHLTNFGAFQPYVGLGIAYAIIFASHDGAVHNLSVQGEGGWALQGGADYYLNRNWSLFVDAKYIFLHVSATGNALGLPVTAQVRLDPTIVSGGVSYHW